VFIVCNAKAKGKKPWVGGSEKGFEEGETGHFSGFEAVNGDR